MKTNLVALLKDPCWEPQLLYIFFSWFVSEAVVVKTALMLLYANASVSNVIIRMSFQHKMQVFTQLDPWWVCPSNHTNLVMCTSNTKKKKNQSLDNCSKTRHLSQLCAIMPTRRLCVVRVYSATTDSIILTVFWNITSTWSPATTTRVMCVYHLNLDHHGAAGQFPKSQMCSVSFKIR